MTAPLQFHSCRCRYIYESDMPVGRLVRVVADKNQVCFVADMSGNDVHVTPMLLVFYLVMSLPLHVHVWTSVLPLAIIVPGKWVTACTTMHVTDEIDVQDCTMSYARRPFGLGLLVVGYDVNGPCLYETCPTGEYWQCQAMALGARSQAAKTYLERHLEVFPEASLDELIKRVLAALHVRSHLT